MEEDGIELIDYFRVIWKRKILIIVGTLVCIVAGVTVSLRLPVIYNAKALIRIGKTVDIGLVSTSLPPFALLDTIQNLVSTIPIEYALKEEDSEYDLTVGTVKGTSLIEIELEGPDERKTKEFLDEVVEKLIDDHLSKTENIIQYYKIIIGNLEADIEGMQDNINEMQSALVEMDADMEKEMSISVDNEISKGMDNEINKDMDVHNIDPFTFMIMQNKKFEILNSLLRRRESFKNNILKRKQIAQDNLKLGRIALRSFQNDIFICQSTINILEENKTRQVGEVENTVNKPRNKRNIILAGVVGLMMSLFLAFFIEYLGSVRERERDSV